jgi:hypothetical protein
MPRTRFLLAALLLSLLLLNLSALTASAADNTWTIQGRVAYPDGRPAAGLDLLLFSWSPQGWDKENTYWKIPNYDQHPVTTGADGSFTMAGVLDHPENTSHRYVIWVTEKTREWYGAANFLLRPENHQVTANLQLEPATMLKVHLKDKGGKPFEGTRAAFVQVGRDLSDPTKGFTSIRELTFVNGVAEMRVNIRDKSAPVARLAVLQFPTRDAARQMLHSRGLSTADNSKDALRFVTKDARGKGQDQEVTLPPNGEVALDFNL